MVRVFIRDRDPALCRHRLIRRGILPSLDRELEFIRRCPGTAVQYLLYLHFALSGSCIGVCDLLCLDQRTAFLCDELPVSFVFYLDRYLMLDLVVGDSTDVSLGLLHDIGIGPGLRELDLSEALCMVRVFIRDRDPALCRHRCAICRWDREGERIRRCPGTALQYLLYLHLALSGSCIGIIHRSSLKIFWDRTLITSMCSLCIANRNSSFCYCILCTCRQIKDFIIITCLKSHSCFSVCYNCICSSITVKLCMITLCKCTAARRSKRNRKCELLTLISSTCDFLLDFQGTFLFFNSICKVADLIDLVVALAGIRNFCPISEGAAFWNDKAYFSGAAVWSFYLDIDISSIISNAFIVIFFRHYFFDHIIEFFCSSFRNIRMCVLKLVEFELSIFAGGKSLHWPCILSHFPLPIAFVKFEWKSHRTEFRIILFLLILIDNLFLSGKFKVTFSSIMAIMTIEMPLCAGIHSTTCQNPASSVTLSYPIRKGRQKQTWSIIQIERVCLVCIKENVIENNLIYFSVLSTGAIVSIVSSTSGFINFDSWFVVHVDRKFTDHYVLTRNIKYYTLFGKLIDDPAGFLYFSHCICTINIDCLSIRELPRINCFDICSEYRPHKRLCSHFSRSLLPGADHWIYISFNFFMRQVVFCQFRQTLDFFRRIRTIKYWIF